MEKIAASMGNRDIEARLRAMESAMVIAIFSFVTMGSLVIYRWAHGDLLSGYPLALMGVSAAAMIALAIWIALCYRNDNHRKASLQAEAETVLKGLSEGRVTSLSRETTAMIEAIVGFRALAVAIHSSTVPGVDANALLTRADLSLATGLSESTIERLEKGMRVSNATRERVAEVVSSGSRPTIARARINALIALGTRSLSVIEAIMLLLGSIPYSRVVSLCVLAMFVFLETMFLTMPGKLEAEYVYPGLVHLPGSVGIVMSLAVLCASIRATTFVRDLRTERRQAGRHVLAGIREGTIRFVSSPILQILRRALDARAVSEAIDAAPPGFFVDCLGDQGSFAGRAQ